MLLHLVFVVGKTSAGDQLQIVPQIPAGRGVDTAFVRGLVIGVIRGAVPHRSGHIAIPLVIVVHITVETAVVVEVAVIFPAALGQTAAHHQFMLAPQQREGTAGVHISGIAGGAANVLTTPHFHPGTRYRVGVVACGSAQIGVVTIDLVVQLQLGDPTAVKVVLQRGKGGAGVLVPVAPVGTVVERAGHGVETAIGVQQRNTTPG